MTCPAVSGHARIPWALAVVTLAGIGGHALLFLGLPLSPWLLPVAAALAWAAARPIFCLPDRIGPVTLQHLLVALVVGTGCIAIAYGCIATQDRSWDGLATWSLTARHLLAGEGLDAPYFADPTVFHYARGYPLLQPILLQQTSVWLGENGGRILFALLWLMLLHGVSRSLRTLGVSGRARTIGLCGIALVPLFTEPGHGSAESGFADLLVAVLLVHGAGAVLTNAAGTAACVALLLPLAKNEGTLHLGVLVVIAAALGHRRAVFAAAVAGTVSLLCWLPVQHRLLTPGSNAAVAVGTLLPALIPGLAAAFGTAVRRWPRASILLVLLAPLAASVCGGSPGAPLAEASAALSTIELNWRGLPAILGSYCAHLVWVRKFGASFLLLLPLAVLAWRQRHALPACWQMGRVLLAYFGLVSAAIVLFLLTLPAEKLALFLREGMGRYLAQTLGVVWLANGLLLQAVAGTASPAQAGAKATP